MRTSTTMVVRVTLTLIGTFVLGCYSPHPIGGTCQTDGQCPPGISCNAGVCGGAAQSDSGAGSDAALATGCSCAGDSLICPSTGSSGSDSTVTCALGCLDGAAARCARLIPSNGVDPGLIDDVSTPIEIGGGLATFNTDTGAITGSFMRPPTIGVAAGIEYQQRGNMGVFVLASLTVDPTGLISFTGTHAAVLWIGGDATFHGPIDGTGGHGGSSIAGPGGGKGELFNKTPGGCGPGGTGLTNATTQGDSGGGGGGGGLGGSKGGAAGATLGGTAGSGCITASVVPLVGGSGGAGGGPGGTAGANGGGGGGAIQISVDGALTFMSTGINVGGSGGQRGLGDPTAAQNGGAGGGGGGGGAILLEAVTITTTMAIFAANGGGGGGGANGMTDGNNGEIGKLGGAAAQGGNAGGGNSSGGGNGGTGTSAPTTDDATDPTANGGGGGGGGGRMHFNTLAGTTQTVSASPQPSWGTIQHE